MWRIVPKWHSSAWIILGKLVLYGKTRWFASRWERGLGLSFNLKGIQGNKHNRPLLCESSRRFTGPQKLITKKKVRRLLAASRFVRLQVSTLSLLSEKNSCWENASLQNLKLWFLYTMHISGGFFFPCRDRVFEWQYVFCMSHWAWSSSW